MCKRSGDRRVPRPTLPSPGRTSLPTQSHDTPRRRAGRGCEACETRGAMPERARAGPRHVPGQTPADARADGAAGDRRPCRATTRDRPDERGERSDACERTPSAGDDATCIVVAQPHRTGEQIGLVPSGAVQLVPATQQRCSSAGAAVLAAPGRHGRAPSPGTTARQHPVSAAAVATRVRRRAVAAPRRDDAGGATVARAGDDAGRTAGSAPVSGARRRPPARLGGLSRRRRSPDERSRIIGRLTRLRQVARWPASASRARRRATRGDGASAWPVSEAAVATGRDARWRSGSRSVARSVQAVSSTPPSTTRTHTWQAPSASCRQPSSSPGHQAPLW